MSFLPSIKNWFRFFGILISIPLLAFPSFAQPAGTVVYSHENDRLTLATDQFEIILSASDGGIISITDKTTGQPVSDGSVDGNLWTAVHTGGKAIGSSSYSGQFESVWDDASHTLTLTYSGDLAVQVMITASSDHAFRMQASVTNHTGAVISDFYLPGHLKIAASGIQDALLPMMPGALINATFFEEGRSFINQYPGVMFADYLALRSDRGSLALYSQRGGMVQPVLLGFERLAADLAYTTITHKYQTWVEDGESWQSPGAVLSIGLDYPAAIMGYRNDNGIDRFQSLTEKLGDAAPVFFAAPMYKLDLAALRIKFADISDAIVEKMNFPGMVHLVAFQPRGHDKNYPDFIPPDSKWGTGEDFTSAVQAIHEAGSLAVPYTNFSWWDSGGPTLAVLPPDTPLTDLIVIRDFHGLPAFESYGPNSGFVMNLHNPFVRNRIAEQHDILLETVGVDGIFEDQWGARNAPYDFNAAGLENYDPSTSYFEGALNHYRACSASNLMTEVGVDVLAENGVAFMGTNYLWDMLGYRSATAGVTSYYPMAGMLLRDKVLLYQHDLAAETWTKNRDMLRWNLAQGYNLSNAFLASERGGLNMENPWLNLVGVFQRYALANYADERVVGFDDLGNNITRTRFSTYTVHANWDENRPYSLNGHTLPPGGVVTQAHDGSVTAGVFTAYNGRPLMEGDHYLLEVRAPDSIQLFQPVGEDTEIAVRVSPSWTAVQVTAYAYDGTPVMVFNPPVEAGLIRFYYRAIQHEQAVGYYEIAA